MYLFLVSYFFASICQRTSVLRSCSSSKNRAWRTDLLLLVKAPNFVLKGFQCSLFAFSLNWKYFVYWKNSMVVQLRRRRLLELHLLLDTYLYLDLNKIASSLVSILWCKQLLLYSYCNLNMLINSFVNTWRS